jgi:hypothetical protein
MKIDYHLNIIGEKSEFSPRLEFISPIVNSKSKIFEITAGNGYGKTFLLNLIGYACFSDKLDEKYILKSIKDSISRYGDKESYNLDYELNFSLPDGKELTLKKEKEGERLYSIDGEESTNYEDLHKKVSVLYDVPVDPSERLNAVIKDLGIWNSNLLRKMTQYWEYLRNVQSDFNNVRDESKISSLNEDIENINNEIVSKERTKGSIKKLINQLEDYQNLMTLIQEYGNIEKINEKLFTAQKKIKTLAKPTKITKKDEFVIAELQSQRSQVRNEVDSILKRFIDLISSSEELLGLIKSNETLAKSLEYIKKEDIDLLLKSNNYVNDMNLFFDNVNELEDNISLFIFNEESGKKFVTYNFLKQLLAQIENLIESEAEEVIENLVKVNSDTFKVEIEKSLELYEVPDFSDVKSFFKESLSKLKSYMAELYKITVKLNKESHKKGVDSDGEKYYMLKGEIDSYKATINEKEKGTNLLKYKMAQTLNIDVSKVSDNKSANLILGNLKQSINNKVALLDVKNFLKQEQTKLSIKEEEIRKLEESKKMNEVRLGLEEKKSDSKFEKEDQEKINRFTKNLGFIIKNLGKFNEVISTINSGDLTGFTDKEDTDFIQIAGNIIAYSMDNKILRPDGEYIRLENYDMLKKVFECEDDIRIKKEDISTGLASANYLRQRIENTEGEYVVVLLDEIGNMAKNTLNEVIKSIKKLEDQNRLVIALLTQPSSDGITINEY